MVWREMRGFSRFHPRFSAGLVSLSSSRLIIQLGAGIIGLFLPIFLYEYFGYAPQTMLWYFLINFGLTIFLLVPGAKLMSRVGLKRMMILGTVFYAGCNALYGLIGIFPNVWLFLGLALFLNNLWRIFYWTPFHTEFAELTDHVHRGRTIAFLTNLSSLISIAAPVLAGLIIACFGFDVLFILSGAIILVSIFPLLFAVDVREEYSFGYWETWRKLFSPERRRMFLAYAADGAQEMVGFLIWPIFIFEILRGDYFEIGAVASFIVLASVVLQTFVGEWSDQRSKHRLLKIGASIYSIGWVIKMFVDSAVQIFIASTFHNFALILMRTPFDALMYEKAADAGHYVDEYTVLREMALTIGRVIMIVALLILLGWISLPWAFLLAAAAALLINVID